MTFIDHERNTLIGLLGENTLLICVVLFYGQRTASLNMHFRKIVPERILHAL